MVMPKYAANGTEISHAVLSGGRPVLSAAEAEIAGSSVIEYCGVGILSHSGHFLNAASAAQTSSALQLAKTAFLKNGVQF